MKPKFTDSHRFSGGQYIPAAKTDITKTFERVRRELAKVEAEQAQKVKQLRRRA